MGRDIFVDQIKTIKSKKEEEEEREAKQIVGGIRSQEPGCLVVNVSIDHWVG